MDRPESGHVHAGIDTDCIGDGRRLCDAILIMGWIYKWIMVIDMSG